MTWKGSMMSAETSRFPSGEMRASDADRDLAIAELSEHFQTGRLTQDEFDDRSARALQARTGRELSELFTDLPGPAEPGGDAPRGMADSPGERESPDSTATPGQPWPGPSWPGPSWRGPSRLDRSPRCRRSGAVVVVGVVAAIAIASLVGSVAHAGHGGVGHGGFGWLIPVLIVVFVLRSIARRR